MAMICIRPISVHFSTDKVVVTDMQMIKQHSQYMLRLCKYLQSGDLSKFSFSFQRFSVVMQHFNAVLLHVSFVKDNQPQ